MSDAAICADTGSCAGCATGAGATDCAADGGGGTEGMEVPPTTLSAGPPAIPSVMGLTPATLFVIVPEPAGHSRCVMEMRARLPRRFAATGARSPLPIALKKFSSRPKAAMCRKKIASAFGLSGDSTKLFMMDLLA